MIDNYILGIDVGFRNTGWVTVFYNKGYLIPTSCGCIKTKPSKIKMRKSFDDFNCNTYLFREVSDLIKRHKPRLICAELPVSGGKSASAIKSMAMASSMVAAVIEAYSTPYELVNPEDSKMALCNERFASKEQMMSKVKELYPSGVWPTKRSYTIPKNRDGAGNKIMIERSDFEHIADAMAAIHAKIGSDLMKERCEV